ncbi:MAG TPA: GNAT family N-acetyltransferase [Terriglobia bacterium]|nr:GNAT family N-acetyltransferase [Terriglobia bacterium]
MENQPPSAGKPKPDISVRPLQERDLPAADRIMRLAFGTFIGAPDPATFMGDVSYVRTRWLANPPAAFGAEVGGELVGSNFATNWGSVGFFGPLTIRPDLWDQGVGKRLMEPVVECFSRWGTKHAGLFTFAQSPKHISLYQKFGFWPRFLTVIMSKPAEKPGRDPQRMTTFSGTPENEREKMLLACHQTTDAVYPGLDVSLEIRAIASQGLGETVLLLDNAGVAALAVCHCGPNTEAGSGRCYVKFGAVRPGPAAGRDFGLLLDACGELAARRGLERLVAGANTARHEAYQQMLERGFRADFQGVAMQKPNEPGYNRPGVYLIDDWR